MLAGYRNCSVVGTYFKGGLLRKGLLQTYTLLNILVLIIVALFDHDHFEIPERYDLAYIYPNTLFQEQY